MTSFLFRVSPFHTGASIILLLPNIAPSRDRANQTIISLGVKVEGFSIGRQGAGGAKEALASAKGCRAAELEATTLLILTPVNYPETSKTSIPTIIGEVKRTLSDSINPTPGVQGDDRSCPIGRLIGSAPAMMVHKFRCNSDDVSS